MWSSVRLQSLLSSLSWKRSNDIGTMSHNSANFSMWLRSKIDAADFGLMTVRQVVANASAELRMPKDQAFKYLAAVSGPHGDFIVEAGLIRIRDLFDGP